MQSPEPQQNEWQLASARLLLRQFTLQDAAFILELLNEPGWKRYIGERGVSDLETARAYLANNLLAAYARHGFGLYAMQQKSDGVLVGMCGLVRREGLEDVDLGFALLARYQGQGLAREAAAAVLAYARERLRLPRLAAITNPDNERSIRLLEQLGLVFQHRLRLNDDAQWLNLYRIEFDPAEGAEGYDHR